MKPLPPNREASAAATTGRIPLRQPPPAPDLPSQPWEAVEGVREPPAVGGRIVPRPPTAQTGPCGTIKSHPIHRY